MQGLITWASDILFSVEQKGQKPEVFITVPRVRDQGSYCLHQMRSLQAWQYTSPQGECGEKAKPLQLDAKWFGFHYNISRQNPIQASSKDSTLLFSQKMSLLHKTPDMESELWKSL